MRVHSMMEEHVVLSERSEDQLKAVEWAREQKKKITDDKNRRIADALMEKITNIKWLQNKVIFCEKKLHKKYLVI